MELEQAKAIFEERGVKTALVVDDLFDAFDEFEAEDLGRAYALFESTDDILGAFQAIGGVAPTDADDLGDQMNATPAIREALKAGVGTEPGPLQDLGHAVFGRIAKDREGRLKPIQDLISVLMSLGVATTAVGSDGPGGADAPHFPIIFMDYYLGSKGAPSVERSRQRIQEIVSHYGPNNAPLVVLMSSELNKKREAGKFRADAKLLGSQFRFAKKAEFEDDNMEFISSLTQMVKFLPQTRTVGAFVKAWSGALHEAVTEFEKGVLELDLQDFFQIHTKLGKDGEHHFGEHVSGLFDGFLRRLVEDRPGLRSATAGMNKLSFAGRPPAPFAPSNTVIRMADASAFQSLPEAKPEVLGRLDIELGDVYLRETGTGRRRAKSAVVVISQSCDLEHGNTDTALMVNGIVSKRSGAKIERAVSGKPIIRTDLFLHEGENLIIDWNAADFQAVKISEFPNWIKERTFEKVARLRPMQALALQQRFASHLTRVGLPETPPPYRYPNIEVMITRGNKKELLFDRISSGELACVIGDEKTEAVLQESLLERIAKSLNEADAKNLDAAQWDQAKDLLSNWQKREAFQAMALKDGKAKVGNIAVMDSDKALTASDGLPKGAWMAINLYD